MGKDKKKEGAWGVNNPEQHKEAGNKLFSEQKYIEAIQQYTLAIELAKEEPSHVYYANRANAFLEVGRQNECIEDCNKAIEIEPTFVKAYFRKAKALSQLDKNNESRDVCKEGLKHDAKNESLVK